MLSGLTFQVKQARYKRVQDGAFTPIPGASQFSYSLHRICAPVEFGTLPAAKGVYGVGRLWFTSPAMYLQLLSLDTYGGNGIQYLAIDLRAPTSAGGAFPSLIEGVALISNAVFGSLSRFDGFELETLPKPDGGETLFQSVPFVFAPPEGHPISEVFSLEFVY